MKKFISDLLSGKSDTSSKRFAALFTLLNLLILGYMAALRSNGILPEFMFNGLLLIVGGGLGLTVIEKIFNKNQTTTTDTPEKMIKSETTSVTTTPATIPPPVDEPKAESGDDTTKDDDSDETK